MTETKSNCWASQTAEKNIHNYARDWDNLELTVTVHAREKMAARDISMSDMRFVLERGHIIECPKAASRGQYKYKICGKTPNSENRTVCLVVIPNPNRLAIKIITVMWRDLS